MKNRFVLILFMLLNFLSIKGQISITVDSIVLNNVIETRDKDLMISGFGYGPVVTMNICVKNTSEEILSIKNHDKYRMYCEYSYDGKKHKSLDIYFTLTDEKYILIPPNSVYKEVITTCLFFLYTIFETGDMILLDHIPILNEVFSDFRLIIEINGTKYESKNIPRITKGYNFFNEHKKIDY